MLPHWHLSSQMSYLNCELLSFPPSHISFPVNSEHFRPIPCQSSLLRSRHIPGSGRCRRLKFCRLNRLPEYHSYLSASLYYVQPYKHYVLPNFSMNSGICQVFALFSIYFQCFSMLTQIRFPPSSGHSTENNGVERYLSPESGSKATIVFPLFSGRFASSAAA